MHRKTTRVDGHLRNSNELHMLNTEFSSVLPLLSAFTRLRSEYKERLNYATELRWAGCFGCLVHRMTVRYHISSNVSELRSYVYLTILARPSQASEGYTNLDMEVIPFL
jgi:hypothetical protein